MGLRATVADGFGNGPEEGSRAARRPGGVDRSLPGRAAGGILPGESSRRINPQPIESPEFLMLSARNQLPATVKSVKLGNVMAEVVMSVGDVEIVAAITRGSAEALGLQAGDSVRAVIKATEVLIDKS